jgi:hypothetical protein
VMKNQFRGHVRSFASPAYEVTKGTLPMHNYSRWEAGSTLYAEYSH